MHPAYHSLPATHTMAVSGMLDDLYVSNLTAATSTYSAAGDRTYSIEQAVCRSPVSNGEQATSTTLIRALPGTVLGMISEDTKDHRLLGAIKTGAQINKADLSNQARDKRSLREAARQKQKERKEREKEHERLARQYAKQERREVQALSAAKKKDRIASHRQAAQETARRIALEKANKHQAKLAKQSQQAKRPQARDLSQLPSRVAKEHKVALAEEQKRQVALERAERRESEKQKRRDRDSMRKQEHESSRVAKEQKRQISLERSQYEGTTLDSRAQIQSIGADSKKQSLQVNAPDLVNRDHLIILALQSDPEYGDKFFSKIASTDVEEVVQTLPRKYRNSTQVHEHIARHVNQVLRQVDMYRYLTEKRDLFQKGLAELNDLQRLIIEELEFGYVQDLDSLTLSAKIASEKGKIALLEQDIVTLKHEMPANIVESIAESTVSDALHAIDFSNYLPVQSQIDALRVATEAMQYTLKFGGTLQMDKDKVFMVQQDLMSVRMNLLDAKKSYQDAQRQLSQWIVH